MLSLTATKRHRMTVLAINNDLDTGKYRVFFNNIHIPRFFIPELENSAGYRFINLCYFYWFARPAIFVDDSFACRRK